MASVPKTTAVAAPSLAQSARGPAPSARVASSSTSMVEALDAGTNISFDTAATGYQDQQNHADLHREGGRRQRFADPGTNRLFTANTQVFAKIFEGDVEHSDRRQGHERNQLRSTRAPVSRIINTYETNALVISGEQPIRGTSFSFNL